MKTLEDYQNLCKQHIEHLIDVKNQLKDSPISFQQLKHDTLGYLNGAIWGADKQLDDEWFETYMEIKIKIDHL